MQKEDNNLKFNNLSNDNDYKSLRPFPNYSYETFPYLMIKDSKSLNVINVRTMQSRVVLRNTQYSWDVLRTHLMDFSTNPASENLTLFNLELVSILPNPNSRVREQVSTVKKFTINTEYLDNCFKWKFVC